MAEEESEEKKQDVSEGSEEKPSESPESSENKEESIPAEGAPAEGAPAEGAPTEGAPAEGAPTEGAPTEGAPTEGAPTEGAPTEGAPAEGAPTEGALAEGALAEGAPAEGEEEMISLEGLDALMAQEDPKFEESLNDIDKGLNEAAQDVKTESLEEPEVVKKKRKLKMPSFLIKIGTFFRWILLKFEKVFLKVIGFGKFLATDGKDRALVWVKSSAGIAKTQTIRFLKFIKDLSWKGKLQAVGILILFGFISVLIKSIVTGEIFKPEKPLFYRSLEEVAESSVKYESDKTEGFYDSFRFAENIILIDRIIVNLKNLENAKATSMGAFELYIVGGSREVVIEIKDRMSEVRDILGRALEEMDYKSLSRPQGKNSMKKALRGELNQNLTTGRVKKVLVRKIVLKR